MENTIVTIFVALALILGGVGGAVLTPNTSETVVEYQDKIVEVPVNVTVEKLVEVPALDMLSLAVDAFLIAVEDDECTDNDEDYFDVLIVGEEDYNFDEMKVNRIYDDYNVSYQDELTTVDFKVKLRFKQEDLQSEKVTYDVTVIFEEDEDTEVKVEVEED